MLPPQCLLQPGQPGSSLLRHRLLHPLPPAHLLLCLARAHHQGHEDPDGGCHISAHLPLTRGHASVGNFDIVIIIFSYSTGCTRSESSILDFLHMLSRIGTNFDILSSMSKTQLWPMDTKLKMILLMPLPSESTVPSGFWLWDRVPVTVWRARHGSTVGQHPD